MRRVRRRVPGSSRRYIYILYGVAVIVRQTANGEDCTCDFLSCRDGFLREKKKKKRLMKTVFFFFFCFLTHTRLTAGRVHALQNIIKKNITYARTHAGRVDRSAQRRMRCARARTRCIRKKNNGRMSSTRRTEWKIPTTTIKNYCGDLTEHVVFQTRGASARAI